MEKKADLQKQRDEKSLLQFFDGLQWANSEKGFKGFVESEGEKIKEIALKYGLSGLEALNDPLTAIYSKVYSCALNNPDVEPVSQADYAVEMALHYFDYIRLNNLMRDLQFEAAAKGEQGVDVYLDGKKLLPPGKHRNGYSVGITSDKDNEVTKV